MVVSELSREERLVEQAVRAIEAGDPVVLPTDTVYGVCATPHRPEATLNLARLKGRDAGQATALLAADVETLLELVPEIDTRGLALLPALLTLVVSNPAGRFPWLGGDNPNTIGVRVPVLAGAAREILRRVGAVAATSANLTGEPDPRRLDEVPEEIRSAAAVIVDGGELPGLPSTVVDLTGSEPVILREGAVPAAEVLERLGQLP